MQAILALGRDIVHFVNKEGVTTLGGRIQAARRAVEGSMSQADLGKLIGKSRAMVARYEGDLDVPSDDLLGLIAQVTGVTYKKLRFGTDTDLSYRNVIELEGAQDSDEYAEVPYWGEVPAGDWQEPSSDSGQTVMIEKRLAKVGTVVVRVAGDSLLPELKHGDRVTIRCSKTPKEGVLTLARNNQNEITLKLLKHAANGQWELLSLNPAYPSATAESWEILGHAIDVRRTDELGIRV